MKKYKVVNGRFSFGTESYEFGQVVELNDSQISKLKNEGIIGEYLEEFVEETKKKETKKSDSVPVNK